MRNKKLAKLSTINLQVAWSCIFQFHSVLRIAWNF